MLALLDRADNEDSTIPAWRSPSLRAVESDTSLAHSTVVTVLAHLEMHGWLERSGQKRGQMPKTKESGRGRSSTRWALLPHDFAPVACICPKPDRPPRDQSKNQIGREATNPDRSRSNTASAGQEPDSTKGVIRGEGDREGEALTVEIAGQRFTAIRCAGCSAPVPVKFAVNGCHPGCDEADRES
jgi:hypothetical protein